MEEKMGTEIEMKEWLMKEKRGAVKSVNVLLHDFLLSGKLKSKLQ